MSNLPHLAKKFDPLSTYLPPPPPKISSGSALENHKQDKIGNLHMFYDMSSTSSNCLLCVCLSIHVFISFKFFSCFHNVIAILSTAILSFLLIALFLDSKTLNPCIQPFCRCKHHDIFLVFTYKIILVCFISASCF
jgi:hypothetical protein